LSQGLRLQKRMNLSGSTNEGSSPNVCAQTRPGSARSEADGISRFLTSQSICMRVSSPSPSPVLSSVLASSLSLSLFCSRVLSLSHQSPFFTPFWHYLLLCYHLLSLS